MTVFNLADALRAGSNSVDRVYLGNDLVWGEGDLEPPSIPSYAEEVLFDQPAAWWRMDDDPSASPALVAATSSSNWTGEGPSQAFDGSVTPGTGTWTTNATQTGWLRAELSVPYALTEYTIRRRADIPNRNPKDWTFEGSNNGSDWTVLDTQVGITWAAVGDKTYSFANATAYRYYRLNVTANNGDTYLSVAELVLTGVATSSTTVPMLDSSGNARHGVYGMPGSPTSRVPVLGAAGLLATDLHTVADFDGVNDVARVDEASWMRVDTLTLEAWVCADVILGTGQELIDSDYSGGRMFQWVIVNGQVRWLIWIGGTLRTIQGSTVMEVGKPYHVVATYDGTTAKIYVNGALDGSGAFAGTLTKGGGIGLSIGAGTGAGSVAATAFLNGRMSDVAFYSGKALTADRIAAHYAAGMADDPYAREVLRSTPYALFMMEETNLVGTWEDTGSLGEDWQVTGGPRGQQPGGPLNSAVAPGGVAAVATRAGIPAALAGANVSASIWFYKPAAFVRGYLMKAGSGPNGWGFGLGNTTMDNDGNNLIVITDGVAWHASGVAFTTGWHHVVAVRGAGTAITVYDNGAVKWSGSLNAGIAVPTGGMTVAGLYDGTPGQRALPSTVLVSQAAWFTGALTAGDVTSLYNGGVGDNTALAALNPTIRLDMDESGDWVFSDETPAGRNLAVVGGVPAAMGLPGPGPGKAVRWDAASTRYLSDIATVGQPTSVTFECWLKYSTNPGAETYIQTFGGSGSYGATSGLSITTEGKLSMLAYTSNGMWATMAAALSKDVWHHVVASVGAAGMKIRVDGVTVATNTRVSANSFVADSRYTVRAGPPFSMPLATSGGFELGPHAVWHNRQLSDAETDAHYIAGSEG